MFVEPSRFRTIVALALPIIGAMLSQTVLNLVDTAMVGVLGDDAIAAVGIGGFANFLCQAFILGLATGVQAMAARRKGEGQLDHMAVPLNGGLLIVVIVALPLSTVLFEAAPALFKWLNNDPNVHTLGSPYLQARLVGMIGVSVNYAFRGYWNGVSQSKLYLKTLLIMHSCNVAISYVLIFGKLGLPALGSTGAGIGTTASTYIGTAYYIHLGWRHARRAGFLRGLPDRKTMVTMLRLSVPTGAQQVFFSGGLVALFWIIGQVGTAEVAAASVLINLMLFALLPGMGLGLAANSLVSQALGRNDAGDAKRWGWDVVRSGVVLVGLLGLPMLLIPELLLSVFLHTPSTVEVAAVPLRIVGAGIAIDAVGLVLMNALLGAGASRTVLTVSVGMQWMVFLPAAYLIGPTLGYGLLGIWVAQMSYRTMLAMIFAALWAGGRWQGIKV